MVGRRNETMEMIVTKSFMADLSGCLDGRGLGFLQTGELVNILRPQVRR
jgi:hypothetical protein